MKNILFQVDGGIGKNISATAILPAIKEKYPDSRIIVVCGFIEPFLYNPLVYRTYQASNASHVYEDLIKDKDFKILRFEPYLHEDYVNKKEHVITCWLDGLALKPNYLPIPKLYLSDVEKEDAAMQVNLIKKPLFILQTHGGVPNQKMYKRNIPTSIAQKIVDRIKNKYHVLHFRFKEHPEIQGAFGSMLDLRQLFSLLPHAKNSLVIDSFVQHAAAGLGLKFNVAWGGTSPKVLGYEINNNIMPIEGKCGEPFCHRPNSYLYDSYNGKPWECPYNEACLNYDPDELLKAIGEA